jgi:hypothetical protein
LNREITRAGVEKREEMVVAYTETPANDENRHKAKAEEEEEEEVRNNNEKMGETVGSRRQQQSSWATTSSSRLYKLKLNQSPQCVCSGDKKSHFTGRRGKIQKKNSNKKI